MEGVVSIYMAGKYRATIGAIVFLIRASISRLMPIPLG